MALASPAAFERILRGGRRGGVFFLFGDEEFLKDEAAARLVEAHLDPATRDFNLDQLRGPETDADTLASILQTPPMMAEWRVVVVREAQAFAGSPRARSAIEAVLDRPLDGLALVLVASIPERSRAQFYERLKKSAVAVEFAPLGPADLPGWLVERASAEGLALAPDAARGLAAAVGSDLGVLVRELDKLRAYVGERAAASLDDVEAVVGRIPRQDRWQWFDLVGERRFGEARAGLPVLLDAGESGVGLVIGLGSQLLRLAIAEAGGPRALESALPHHQRWLAGRLAAQARHWTRPELVTALDDLLRADRLLKSSAIGDLHVLDELLLRLQARSATTATA